MEQIIILVTGEYFDAGFIGLFGGTVNYFYFIDKYKFKFQIKDILTTCGIAFFIGMVAYIFLPETTERPGYLLLCGFFSYKIIDFLDRNSNKMLRKIFRNGGT